MNQRWRIFLQGTVQGVGFRPHVFRLAQRLRLGGWIRNETGGVCLEVQGPPARLQTFLERLQTEAPPLARIRRLQIHPLPLGAEQDFRILPSPREGSDPVPLLPPDVALCPDCLAEIQDPDDRRHQYPFTHCTQCGPRFSVVEALPYDRERTTYRWFPLCPACQQEYHNPLDRRFEAQAIACPQCGPQLEWWDEGGAVRLQGLEALQQAVRCLQQGRVVALKGMGGYQILVDATSEAAVHTLRQRKGRGGKPFAVMFPSLEALLQWTVPSPREVSLLQGPESPIVLLRKRRRLPRGIPPLAEAVAPDNPWVGSMLPYTPLHHLLLQRVARPLVCTSGNRSEEVLCYREEDVRRRLVSLVDGVLNHNRPIARHMDDSVVRVVEGRPLLLRRARGYVPRPVPLSRALPPVLAVGGDLKNTVAVTQGAWAVLSQHIGDLATLATWEAFQTVIRDWLRFFRVTPRALASDLHPGYLTTQWAQEEAQRLGIPWVPVQHHHAHIVACMAEHHLEAEVLGVAWDGTGFGPDGTLWGGEFLLSRLDGFQRMAHLEPLPLLGGEQAIREPRRVALALLILLGKDPPSSLGFSSKEIQYFQRLLQKGPVSWASSIGRLFDGIAALLGIRLRNTFEGEAPQALEALAQEGGKAPPYPHPVEGEAPPWRLPWGPLVEALLQDQRQGRPLSWIASRLHTTLAMWIGAVARRVRVRQVVLSGGAFQNKLLLTRTLQVLRGQGFQVFWPHQVPPNDGGLSLGQAVVAGVWLEAGRAPDA